MLQNKFYSSRLLGKSHISICLKSTSASSREREKNMKASPILAFEDAHKYVCKIDSKEKVRLDSYLSKKLESTSRTLIQYNIKIGKVKINNKECIKPSVLLKNGDIIQYGIEERLPSEIEPECIPLDIIYEDEDIIIINKAPGMVVHPSPGHMSGTLVNALMHKCKCPSYKIHNLEQPPLSFDALKRIETDKVENKKNLKKKKRDINNGKSDISEREKSEYVFRPGIVHRLDIGTSGLMVVSKSDFAHAQLSEQFLKKTIQRSYLSILVGTPSVRSGRVCTNIARDPINRTLMTTYAYKCAMGKTAASNYDVLDILTEGNFSLTSWKLETGRTHQIRVHAKYIGFPILGDISYGGSIANGVSKMRATQSLKNDMVAELDGRITRPLLHSHKMTLTHPITLNSLTFEVPPPQDFQDALNILKSITTLNC